MKKILVFGAFGYTNNQLDGQTVKTRNVYKLLVDRYDGVVMKSDSIEIKRKPWLIFSFFLKLVVCNTLIIIPCLNNMTYAFPIVYMLSKVFKYNIVSICIGGWQVEYFKGNERFKPHPRQLRYSKGICAFLPEMEKVNNDLIEKFDFKNTEVFPNFRFIEHKEIPIDNHDELRLVFMARINKKKGYRVVFDVLDKLHLDNIPVTMTFYGQIADEDRDDFERLLSKHSYNTKYEGALNPNDIQRTLLQYDVLLLPTQYYTEGFPGSILDAYIAGVPVIVTEWKHSHEFVKDSITGFIVPFENGVDVFVERIRQLNDNREKLTQMKLAAREQCNKYSETAAWDVLKKYI